MEAGAEHERRALLHHIQLLGGDVGDRRAQPSRVLEPDAGQHLHLRRDHVGRVVATAETGLDHRCPDSPARQLRVGGRRQGLELSHAVIARERVIDELRCVRGALHGRREGRRLEVLIIDPDPLRERHKMG